MSWSLVQQEDGSMVRVVRYFPKINKETGEKEGLGRLKHPVSKVQLRSSLGGEPVTVQWNCVEFSVQFADTEVYRKIKLGRGREVDDILSPKVVKKGPREVFQAWESLKATLTRRGVDKATLFIVKHLLQAS